MCSYLVCSDDHGETWRISSNAGRNINEPTVVQLDDGALMINARSQRRKGCRATVVSTDGGESWSSISDEPVLIEPNCQGCFIRHSSAAKEDGKSRLLFSNPASAEKGDRRNMTVRLSYDEGKTWVMEKQIYAGPSRYSCMAVLPNGEIGLLYERDSFSWGEKKNANKKISLARFSLSWLTDGRE